MLKKRQDIPQEYRWNLGDIYSKNSDWEKDFELVKDGLARMDSYKGRLVSAPCLLAELLSTYSWIMEKAEKLFIYAHMKKDEDNTNTGSQALLDRAQSLLVQTQSVSSFIIPEILNIPAGELKRLKEKDCNLKDYIHFLDNIERQREHVLSPEEEKILALSGEVAAAPSQIFNMINNADMKFPVIRDEEGKDIEVTKGRYHRLLESRERRVRKDAFDAFYDSYEKQKNTIASTLNYSIKKDIFISGVRNYPSCIHAALFDDNAPLSVYDNLISAVNDNLNAMYRYVMLRKKILGVDHLHMFDLYVPIVEDIDLKITYMEAKDIVLESLVPLGQEYVEIAREGLSGKWVDVYENQGKTGGAYSWGCYDTHPYILMNYENNIDNLFTLAHEMGHAIHTYLSNSKQPYINAGYKIFVAEVASILNEILLTEYLLKNFEDKKKKAFIMNHYLEQFRGTVYRQTMFAEFEKIIHDNAEKGIPLTLESLNTIYHGLNVRYYGPEIVLDEKIDLEWARVPHFYNAFYVYKYAIGFAAGAALSRKILDGDQNTVKNYIDFLSSGGSDYPINLLRGAGVDMTSPRPVRDALKIFENLVSEVESLLFTH